MALPLSIQLQQQEEERKAQIERETTLDAIRESIVQTVPLALGTVIGTVTKSPALGLIGSFVTDKIQEAYKQGRERRIALSKEKRQRKEAARILVERGLAVDEEQALQRIEIAAAEKQQRIIKQNEDNALSEYDLLEKQKSEPTVAELGDDGGDPKRLVSEGGMALESTLEHIDSEVSGLTDVLLEKFADDEKVQDRQERKEERKEALERERLAEERRSNAKQEKLLEEQGDPQKQEEEGGGILSFITEKLGTVLGVAGGISLAGGGGLLGALGLGGAAAAGGATAGIGATLASIGTGIAGLGATLVSAPVLGIVGGTAAVAAGVYGLTQVDWEGVSNDVGEFSDGLKEDFSKIGEDLSAVGEDIGKSTGEFLDSIGTAVAESEFGKKVGGIVDSVTSFFTSEPDKPSFAEMRKKEGTQEGVDPTTGRPLSGGTGVVTEGTEGEPDTGRPLSGGTGVVTEGTEGEPEKVSKKLNLPDDAELIYHAGTQREAFVMMYLTKKEDESNGISSGYAVNPQEDGTYTVSRIPNDGDERLEGAMDVGTPKQDEGEPKQITEEPQETQAQFVKRRTQEMLDSGEVKPRGRSNRAKEAARQKARIKAFAEYRQKMDGESPISAESDVERVQPTPQEKASASVTSSELAKMSPEEAKAAGYIDFADQDDMNDRIEELRMKEQAQGEPEGETKAEFIKRRTQEIVESGEADARLGSARSQTAAYRKARLMAQAEYVQREPQVGRAMMESSADATSGGIASSGAPTTNNVVDAKTINNQTTIQKSPLQPKSVETQNKFAMMN